MDAMNPQQKQTPAAAYQYNYSYIEPIAMVATLPQQENFSEPWLVLTGKQAIRLAINTFIANQGDRGKQGIEDDVRQFLGKTLLQTLQEAGTTFKPRLINALISLLPQILLPSTSPTKTEVKVSKTIETTVQQPLSSVPSTGAIEVSKTIETTVQQPLTLSLAEEVEVSKSIATALQQLLKSPSQNAPSTAAVETSIGVERALQSSPSVATATIEVSRGIDRALQQPLSGIPSNESEVEKFVTSKLIKILGEDFLKTFAKNLLKGLKEKSPTGRASSIEDYLKLFAYIDPPESAKTFQSDEFFAYMRVAGPNPVMIERMTAPDARFPVTEEQYQSQMGDADSLQIALQEGRVYLADYAALDGALNGTLGAEPQSQKYAYAPLAMFAVPAIKSSDRLLRPVAIQCGQTPADYPVITPSTGADAWLMAKTVVQIADANFHEAVTHFARTHLLVESFVIATHRQLPATHFLFKLLVPHFQGTLAINYAAHQFLVAPGGGVDELLSSTIDNSRVLMVKGFQIRGFNQDMLPRRLQERGVNDQSMLPVYPYRDDGLLIWGAIHDWVETYLGLYYNSDDDLKNDLSLQNWAQELVAFDGGRLEDFGDRGDGKIETLDYLIDAVTMVIFTGSAQHAAVNFPQNGVMSFAPAMPTAGYVPAQAIRAEASQKDWLDLLPPLAQAQSQLNLLYLLGSVYFTKLGDYEDGYFTDSKVAALLMAFQNRLQDIAGVIDRRNRDRPLYDYLKPANIPQSINI